MAAMCAGKMCDSQFDLRVVSVLPPRFLQKLSDGASSALRSHSETLGTESIIVLGFITDIHKQCENACHQSANRGYQLIVIIRTCVQRFDHLHAV